MTTKSRVCSAIQSRRVIKFQYRGQPRIVEPHKVGQTTRGNDALDGFQSGGRGNDVNPPDWGQFLLPKISGLTVTDQTFDGPRPKYSPTDERWIRVYCRL